MKRLITVLVGVALVAPLLTSCGDEETPEQRIARLRSRHEIYPAGITTLTDGAGYPTLVVDVQVANQGTEPLNQLTVLIKVRGTDGADRLSERVVIDLEGIRPGTGERRTARVPGIALEEDDEVYVEIEANLTDDDLHTLAEWSEAAGPS
jgi:hypothetical protein